MRYCWVSVLMYQLGLSYLYVSNSEIWIMGLWVLIDGEGDDFNRVDG